MADFGTFLEANGLVPQLNWVGALACGGQKQAQDQLQRQMTIENGVEACKSRAKGVNRKCKQRQLSKESVVCEIGNTLNKCEELRRMEERVKKEKSFRLREIENDLTCLTQCDVIKFSKEFNDGWTGINGSIIVSRFEENDLSKYMNNGRFKYIEHIGEGTFSTLLCVQDCRTNEFFAVKVMNYKNSKVGKQEAIRLNSINIHYRNKIDNGSSFPILNLLGTFVHHGHYCLVLPLMGKSLFRYIGEMSNILNKNEFDCQYPFMFNLTQIRMIAIQLLTAMHLMHNDSMLHADLKPENVLLTKRAQYNKIVRSGTNSNSNNNNIDNNTNNIGVVNDVSIKVIDFGNVILESEIPLYYSDFKVQSLFYRAPEVLFGLKFDYSIDLWSIGCILIELLLGKPIFKCKNENDLAHEMYDILGSFPQSIYRYGVFYSKYFDNPNMVSFNDCYQDQLQRRIKGLKNVFAKKWIVNGQWGKCAIGDSQAKFKNKEYRNMWNSNAFDQFIDFCAKLLDFNPAQRMTIKQATMHCFLSTSNDKDFGNLNGDGINIDSSNSNSNRNSNSNNNTNSSSNTSNSSSNNFYGNNSLNRHGSIGIGHVLNPCLESKSDYSSNSESMTMETRIDSNGIETQFFGNLVRLQMELDCKANNNLNSFGIHNIHGIQYHDIENQFPSNFGHRVINTGNINTKNRSNTQNSKIQEIHNNGIVKQFDLNNVFAQSQLEGPRVSTNFSMASLPVSSVPQTMAAIQAVQTVQNIQPLQRMQQLQTLPTGLQSGMQSQVQHIQQLQQLQQQVVQMQQSHSRNSQLYQGQGQQQGQLQLGQGSQVDHIHHVHQVPLQPVQAIQAIQHGVPLSVPLSVSLSVPMTVPVSLPITQSNININNNNNSTININTNTNDGINSELPDGNTQLLQRFSDSSGTTSTSGISSELNFNTTNEIVTQLVPQLAARNYINRNDFVDTTSTSGNFINGNLFDSFNIHSSNVNVNLSNLNNYGLNELSDLSEPPTKRRRKCLVSM